MDDPFIYFENFSEIPRTKLAESESRLEEELPDLETYENFIRNIVELYYPDFGASSYLLGETEIPAVQKISASYTGTLIYNNISGDKIGEITIYGNNISSLTVGLGLIANDPDIINAMGGFPDYYSHNDKYSTTFVCHDNVTGENYRMIVTRAKIKISGYISNTILDHVSAWASGTNEHIEG